MKKDKIGIVILAERKILINRWFQRNKVTSINVGNFIFLIIIIVSLVFLKIWIKSK